MAELSSAEGAQVGAKRIFDVAHPSSQRALAQIIGRLVEQGLLMEIISVESEDLGPIAEYGSLDEVPEYVHDFKRDVEVPVRPENLKLYYRLGPATS